MSRRSLNPCYVCVSAFYVGSPVKWMHLSHICNALSLYQCVIPFDCRLASDEDAGHNVLCAMLMRTYDDPFKLFECPALYLFPYASASRQSRDSDYPERWECVQYPSATSMWRVENLLLVCVGKCSYVFVEVYTSRLVCPLGPRVSDNTKDDQHSHKLKDFYFILLKM